MSKVRWLDRRTAFPGPFVALCLTDAQFVAACKSIKRAAPPFLPSPWSEAAAHYFQEENTVIVCMGKWMGRNPIEVAGLLVHEAVHIWQEYAARIGERNPGSEQEAYAIQAISQELMAEFARQMEAMP